MTTTLRKSLQKRLIGDYAKAPKKFWNQNDLEMKWSEAGEDLKVEADTDIAWGIGTKVLIWDFKDCGIKLSGSASYRNTDPGIKEVSSQKFGIGKLLLINSTKKPLFLFAQ